MYTEKVSLKPIGALGPGSLASAAQVERHVAMTKLKIHRVALKVTTAIVSTGTVVVVVKKRPTVGSGTGEVVLATLNIPAATAANKVIYKDISPASILPGDEVCFDVTTAAAGGGAAGAGVGLLEAYAEDELPANNANFAVTS